MLPPVGYPYWCSHRTLRVLAERLAAAGHSVLRIDYDGTGDSAGDQWDADRVEAWRASARAAVDEMRALGCAQLTVIGVRLGATFALLDGATLGADRVVAWAPVVKGRRYAKELRLLSTEVPPADDPAEPAGTIVAAGNVFTARTLEQLAGLSLERLATAPAASTLIVDDPTGAARGTEDQLRALGAEVVRVELPDGELALETPPEFAAVPERIAEQICSFVGVGPGASAPAPAPRSEARIRWRGATVSERLVELQPHGHVAVICAPADPDPARPVVAFLNPGSETHVGPGRAWVEYARGLAEHGYTSVRVDLRGWGESPDDGRAPGRPYDPCGIEDAAAIVEELRAIGYERVVLLGLCASAWIALRTVLQTPVAGVIALNPQMYWQQGDPVEIDWDQIRARRAQEIKRIETGSRWHLWSALDGLAVRGQAGSWLDQLAATGVPIKLLFAEGDDGLVFLRGRHARRLQRSMLAGPISLRELPGVDHPMHRAWIRPRVIDALVEALMEIGA